MRLSIKKGFGFGITSGVITTLGLIVGLHSSTHSTSIIIGGILVIAIADAMSDALGIHISEEAEIKYSNREIWESTFITFLSKFVFTLTFIVPIILLPLNQAIIASVIWGLFLIVLFSYYLANQQNIKARLVISEHFLIAILVIITTHYLGEWVAKVFS